MRQILFIEFKKLVSFLELAQSFQLFEKPQF